MKIKTIMVGLASIIFLYACSMAQTVNSENESLDIKQIQATIESNNFTKQLDNLFEREMAYGHFSGVAMIQYQGKTIYGISSAELPNGIETRFDIGSISKQFTATAILELVNTNRLSLSDPINDHLGEFASKKWKNINIHHLLTHTSGVPSIYQTEQGLDIFFPQEEDTNLDFLIKKFKDKKLLFSPGEEFSYSNSGYVLLAAIIQNISEMPFQPFLEENVFKKYGLDDTSFKRDGNSANPYYGYRHDLLEAAPIYHSSWMIGGGGIYSTSSDLLKWIEIIQSDTFLTGELRSTFLKSHTNAGYGYGWQFDKKGKIQHDGGSAGFISFLSFHQESELGVTLLTNRSFKDIKMYGNSAAYVSGLTDKIWNTMEGKEIEVLPQIVERTIKQGTYSLDDRKLTIQPKSDSTCTIHVSDAPVTRMIPNSPIIGRDTASFAFRKLVDALENKRYWKVAKYGNGEMRFVCYSGLMAIGMKQMKKQTGEIERIVPYKIAKNHGLMRMKGPLGNLDLIVYLNEEGEMKGVFEHGFYDVDHPQTQLAYVIDDNTLFVDGLPYGERSCKVIVEDDLVRIKQFDRVVELTESK